MLYDLKYPDIRPGEEIDGMIWSLAKDKCAHCHRSTHFIEINFEAYICSEECNAALTEAYKSSCK